MNGAGTRTILGDLPHLSRCLLVTAWTGKSHGPSNKGRKLSSYVPYTVLGIAGIFSSVWTCCFWSVSTRPPNTKTGEHVCGCGSRIRAFDASLTGTPAYGNCSLLGVEEGKQASR